MANSNKSAARLSGMSAARILLVVFFAVAVIVPVVALLLHLASPGALGVFSTPALGTALGNSVVSALLGTALSVALALAAALTLTRTNVPFRNVWAIVLTLPMLTLSIAHGMGLVYLFGSDGIVTNFLGTSWNIYGLQGIVMGALLYSFPPAFLMPYDALRYENCQVYDAADIMGIPKASQFARITLPYLARPLVSTVFATFTLIITDYGLPIMVGGKYSTLSVLMYQDVIGRLNFDSGVAIGVALILPAILAFVVDLLTNVQGNLAFSVRSKRVGKNPGRDLVGWVLLIALALFLVSPLVAFSVVAFVVKYPITMTPTLANIDRAMVFGMDEYWINLGTHARQVWSSAPPRLHHHDGHPRHRLGPRLHDVLQGVHHLWHHRHPHHGESRALLCESLPHGLQRPEQAQRKPRGRGPDPRHPAPPHDPRRLHPADLRHHRRDDLVLLRELHGHDQRRGALGKRLAHAVGAAHQRP
nr:ABC transporter permease subunit [uncultured Parolsenella sp.]